MHNMAKAEILLESCSSNGSPVTAAITVLSYNICKDSANINGHIQLYTNVSKQLDQTNVFCKVGSMGARDGG